MKKARNAPVGHGSENANHVKDQKFQAVLSAILRVQLGEPLEESLDGFERQVHANEEQSGKPFLDEILAATVIAGIDNATVAHHLALNDATLDTYPKMMDAVRSLVRASRGWSVSADGDPMDVDAMIKGRGEGKRGKAKGN